MVAERGGVESVGYFPQFFGAGGGGVDAARVPTGQGGVRAVTDDQHGKRARGDSFFRRDFGRGKSGERLSAVDHHPGAGREECFAEQRVFLQAGVVVRGFAERCERSFGDYGFDARVGAGGLQRDAGAHGFAEGEEMEGFRLLRRNASRRQDR